MIPVNYLGSHFLNPAINQNRPIITARLPVTQDIVYKDFVDTGSPVRARLVTFGLASVRIRDLITIPRAFTVTLQINGVHDIAMVDRIE